MGEAIPMSGLTISLQATPNPHAVKFTLNRRVAAQGATYRDAASADADWARRLLEIPGVAQVFAVNDFIAITKGADAAWDAIVPRAERVLRDVFANQGG